jgi:hypothetical protein
VLAALAVGGLFLAIVAWFKKQRGEVNADERIRVGLNYFGAATIANFLIGGIFLATLPNQVVAETFSSKLALLCMLGSALFGLISVVLAFGRLVWPATCANYHHHFADDPGARLGAAGLSLPLLQAGFIAGQPAIRTCRPVHHRVDRRACGPVLHAKAGLEPK